jgi:hypothetical protein
MVSSTTDWVISPIYTYLTRKQLLSEHIFVDDTHILLLQVKYVKKDYFRPVGRGFIKAVDNF